VLVLVVELIVAVEAVGAVFLVVLVGELVLVVVLVIVVFLVLVLVLEVVLVLVLVVIAVVVVAATTPGTKLLLLQAQYRLAGIGIQRLFFLVPRFRRFHLRRDVHGLHQHRHLFCKAYLLFHLAFSPVLAFVGFVSVGFACLELVTGNGTRAPAGQFGQAVVLVGYGGGGQVLVQLHAHRIAFLALAAETVEHDQDDRNDDDDGQP